MAYEKVSLDIEDRIATLKFNHPEVMNAIGGEMLGELTAAVGELSHPKTDARCLLITGTGRGFCAGANLQDSARNNAGAGAGAGGGNSSGGAGSTLRGGYHPLLCAIRDLEMPVVTAVNGAAAGVGMSFALMGDIVCAGRSAYFLQAFARIGLVPDGGATFLLPRLIGWGRAMELSMLAEKLPAEQALEWGLVNRVFDDADLMPEAMQIARKLADGPRSVTLMRKAYWASYTNSYESQLDLEARLQTEAGSTADFKEGVGAFLEKRPAQFTGQ